MTTNLFPVFHQCKKVMLKRLTHFIILVWKFSHCIFPILINTRQPRSQHLQDTHTYMQLFKVKYLYIYIYITTMMFVYDLIGAYFTTNIRIFG